MMTAQEQDAADDKAARERLGAEANVPDLSKHQQNQRQNDLYRGLLPSTAVQCVRLKGSLQTANRQGKANIKTESNREHSS